MGVNRCMHEFKRKDGELNSVTQKLHSCLCICWEELVNSLWAFAVFGSMEAVD